MIVEIKELGYVKSIKVDLSKDLIILCGPNNTGKTYVAYAIYGLMKNSLSNIALRQRTLISPITSLLNKGELELDLIEILDKIHTPLLDRYVKFYVTNLDGVFAYDEDFFSKTSVAVEINDIEKVKDKIASVVIKNVLDFPNLSVSLNKVKGSPKLKCLFIKDKAGVNSSNTYSNSTIFDYIARDILKVFLGIIFPKSYIAPAERIAINLFSKELSLQRNVLVDQLLELKEGKKDSNPFDLITRRATRYPLPIRDSLEIAEDLINFKKNKSNFNDFADEIESGILKGKVNISREGEVQFKPQKGKVTLPIHLSSSAVKSLSNLVVYFRHLANENDFIIIDEPELNLHPDNQVIIARIIAKIVNKGFKVLINTHSDYIIRELNNLIMMSSQKKFDNYNYSKDEILRSEQVEALLFHYDTRKVESLEVAESGFEVETIDRVTNELNNLSQALYFDTTLQNDE